MKSLLLFISFLLLSLLSEASASTDNSFVNQIADAENAINAVVKDIKKSAIQLESTLENAITTSKKAAGRWSKKLKKALKHAANPNKKKSPKLRSKKLDDTFTVVTHESFPRHQIRYKTTRKLCDPTVKQVTGYLDVDATKHFFFWFFESRNAPKSDPLILWLNGGPGCSSLTGLFMELGPCRAEDSGEGTIPNPYSWNDKANVIFLDQPVNVGFSYADSGETTNTVDAAKDVYAFLQIFLQDFDQYAPLDFHVTGESYAGHYIPAIATEIINGNYELPEPNDPEYPDDPLPEDPPEDVVYVNLKSVAIGNGLTDPLTQYEYYADMAEDSKYGPLLDQGVIEGMRSKYPTCASLINSCYSYQNTWACVPGSFYCNSALIQPFQQTGLNIYDVRKKCDPDNSLCYAILSGIEKYLNKPEVQKEIGVKRDYQGCNTQINLRFLMAGDWMRPYHQLVPGILDEGVRVLIYAGDADYICNHFGNKAWTLELEWDGKEGFNDAEDRIWKNKAGEVAGEFRSYEGLTYLRVNEAGHMVPYDQPENSLEFLNAWISAKELKSE